MARRGGDWLTLGFDAWLLGLEVAQVVWLRGWLLALGGAVGDREARRMVEEKLSAHAAYWWLLASGQGGRTAEAVAGHAMRHYGRKVRANRKRLTRPPRPQ